MRGFGGNGPYTVILVMLCFGVGLDAIYLERPVWEVDVGGRRPRPFVMPQQSYGGSPESELGDWSWNNPDLMYYQPDYNSAEYAESQGPDAGYETQLSERTHFQEAQQASQVKKPVYEAEEQQVPYLAPRPYAVPQPMEQDREDGWGKPMLYQPNWQSETAPARPYQPPQPQEQQSRPPKPNQMPPRVPGDRQQGQWAEKGPENDLKESLPSASTADRLMQLQMLQQQQWMQEQQLKQQELAQQQNQLRQQEMIQQQLKQQQLLQQQQEQQQKLQQQKLKQQQLQQEQERLKQQQEAQRLQEEEKQRELELLERQKELKRQQEEQRQQELIQQQQEQMRQRELQRQQELQQQQQQEQIRLQELQQQKLKQPQPYMPVQPVQPKPAPVQRPVKRPQPNYNPQPEYYAGANDDDDDPYEPVPYQKPVISVDARCPRNDDPAKPVHLPSTSCSKFMKCFNGIAYEMSCPGGLEFDKKTNRCDYAAIARCSKP